LGGRKEVNEDSKQRFDTVDDQSEISDEDSEGEGSDEEHDERSSLMEETKTETGDSGAHMNETK
jgi:hypothetical protein